MTPGEAPSLESRVAELERQVARLTDVLAHQLITKINELRIQELELLGHKLIADPNIKGMEG